MKVMNDNQILQNAHALIRTAGLDNAIRYLEVQINLCEEIIRGNKRVLEIYKRERDKLNGKSK